jgi:signal peptidase I
MTLTKVREPEAISALKCELAADVLRSSGKLRLQVMGWSMLPSVLPGDTLLIERTGGEQISTGDIVLFHREGRLFAHRVVTKTNRPDDRRTISQQIVTQGDGIPWPDPPIGESNLLGKVTLIVRNGRLIEPGKKLDLPQRAISMLVRRSASAARMIAGIHGMRRSSAEAD